MKSLKRRLLWTAVVAALLAVVVAGGATAQAPVVKIGLLATLEGPFAAGGQDGMRGADLAVKQRGGMVARVEVKGVASQAGVRSRHPEDVEQDKAT